MFTDKILRIFCVNLVFLFFKLNVSESRLSSPLIKNVYRGGIHFEGPSWVKDENALYWVDIDGQTVYRLDEETGAVTSRHTERGPVSFVVRVKDYPKVILLSIQSELHLLSWDAPANESSFRRLCSVDMGKPDNRCNDGKVDAKGRLWFGTMGKEVDHNIDNDQATLYMVTEHNYRNPEVKVRPVSISNGIAWTSDNKFMFYIDSPTKNVDVFDFDLDTGTIRNRRTIFSFPANNVTGVPDGMTIDTDDNLWVACNGGSKVIKIDSRAGKLLEHHKLPANQITSVMWGGPDLSTLYVTSSKRGLSAAQLAREPEAGSLFAIEGTGARGYLQNQFVFPNADKY